MCSRAVCAPEHQGSARTSQNSVNRKLNFRECPTCEVRRIPLLRGWVNKGKREVRYLYSRPHREGSKSLNEGIRSSVVRPCGARFPVEVCPLAYLIVHILCGPDLQHPHLAFLASRSGAPTS